METHALAEYQDKHEMTLRELAQQIGISEPVLCRWKNGSRPIPAERAVQIEERTGIPRSKLRPDLWAPASQSA